MMSVLNRSDSSAVSGSCESLVDLSRDLQKSMLALKSEFITDDGRGVDYASMRTSTLFDDYKAKAEQLQTADVSKIKGDDHKAFFINIYNALTVHGLLALSAIPSSVLEVQDFWKKTAYQIGTHVYSLDDIEHGILRGNRVHPSSKKAQFSEGDPRLEFCCSRVDPRIHFALVCGAKSCPPVRIFNGAKLDAGLARAAKSFCGQEIEVNLQEKKVTMSKIFDWYGGDFGDTAVDVLKYCLDYLSGKTKDDLSLLLEQSESSLKIDYKPYNWQLNKA